MSNVNGDPCGNRKARAPRPASRGAKTAPQAVFRAGEIPAQVFIECELRAGHARPLRGGDGEMRNGGRFRRGEGTPPYARILGGAVGRPALWPPWRLAAAGSTGRDESLPYELTATGIWRRVAGRACPAPTRGVDG